MAYENTFFIYYVDLVFIYCINIYNLHKRKYLNGMWMFVIIRTPVLSNVIGCSSVGVRSRYRGVAHPTYVMKIQLSWITITSSQLIGFINAEMQPLGVKESKDTATGKRKQVTMCSLNFGMLLTLKGMCRHYRWLTERLFYGTLRH